MTHLNTAPKASSELGKAIENFVGKARQTDTARVTVLDLMVAFGWKSTDLISPKSADSTATVETFEWLNHHIVLGFTVAAQKLLGAETTKGMSDEKKANRRYYQQQIGAKRNDLKTSLAKRESAKASGAASGKRGFYQIVDDQLATWIKRADREADTLKGLDVVAFKKEVAKLQAMVRKANKA